MVESVIAFFNSLNIPTELIVLFISVFPAIELRGSIPAAIFIFGMHPLYAAMLSILGNILIIPIILLCLRVLEKLSLKYKWGKVVHDKLEHYVRKRHTHKVKQYEMLALFIFVSIPLPGTGAWTGALVAHIFGFPWKKSFALISLGVITAGVIITLLSTGITLI